MSSWILSIVSVVVLTTLLDLFMAEGKTKKYIKSIMSIIIIAVIIAPLPKFLKKDISVAETFSQSDFAGSEITFDEDYLFRIYSAQFSAKEDLIKKSLAENGIEKASIKINFYQFNDEMKIINVLVSLEKAVISEKYKNININNTIYEIVNRVLKVSQELVIIYGKDNKE